MRRPDSFGPAARPSARDDRSAAPRLAAERRDDAARALLVERVLAEFREMPCLRLTAEQAQRLFGLRPEVSARILDALVDQGDLRVDSEGRYAAASDAS